MQEESVNEGMMDKGTAACLFIRAVCCVAGERRGQSERRKQAAYDHRAATGTLHPLHYCPHGEDLTQTPGKAARPLSSVAAAGA